MADTVSKNLGVITAYGMALEGGYSGTKEQFYAVLNEITKGQKIVQITDTTQSIQPKEWTAYTCTLIENTTFTIANPEEGYAPTFELWITQPSNPFTVTFTNTILWGQHGIFSSSISQPNLNTGNTKYILVFRYDGNQYIGNLAYKVEI